MRQHNLAAVAFEVLQPCLEAVELRLLSEIFDGLLSWKFYQARWKRRIRHVLSQVRNTSFTPLIPYASSIIMGLRHPYINSWDQHPEISNGPTWQRVFKYDYKSERVVDLVVSPKVCVYFFKSMSLCSIGFMIYGRKSNDRCRYERPGCSFCLA